MSAEGASPSAAPARRPRGRTLALSRPRRLVNEILHLSRGVPAVSMRLELDVRVAAERRAMLTERPGWSALLMKACGRAAVHHPALRQAFMPLPSKRIYEYPFSIATLILEREIDGEPGVIFDQVRAPEHCSIALLDDAVRHLRTVPIESVGGFRRLLRLASYPLPLRRLLIAGAFYGSGSTRARYFGTFAVNALRAPHAEMTHFLSPLAISLHYGRVREDGRMPILVLFDHRVIDARPVIRMFDDVAATLAGEVADELSAMAADAARAGQAAR